MPQSHYIDTYTAGWLEQRVVRPLEGVRYPAVARANSVRFAGQIGPLSGTLCSVITARFGQTPIHSTEAMTAHGQPRVGGGRTLVHNRVRLICLSPGHRTTHPVSTRFARVYIYMYAFVIATDANETRFREG